MEIRYQFVQVIKSKRGVVHKRRVTGVLDRRDDDPACHGISPGVLVGGSLHNAAGVNDVTGRSAGQVHTILTFTVAIHSMRDFLLKKWQVDLPLFQRPNFTWVKGGCVGVALFLAARKNFEGENMTNNGHESSRVAFVPPCETVVWLSVRGSVTI